jgi:hypothetical protein
MMRVFSKEISSKRKMIYSSSSGRGRFPQLEQVGSCCHLGNQTFVERVEKRRRREQGLIFKTFESHLRWLPQSSLKVHFSCLKMLLVF